MRIALVMPAFNVATWVGAALDSAIGQVPPPDDIVVVDDGSTDGTPESLRTFKDSIRVIRQENRGLAAARNAGAKVAAEAGAEAIFFLDADDAFATTSALGRFTNALERHPDAGVVTSNFTRVLAGADPANAIAWPAARSERILTRPDLAGILRRNWLQTNSLMRTKVWRTHPFHDDVTKDLDLWIRLLADGVPIVVLGEPLLRITTGRAGALTTQRELMRANRRRTFESAWRRGDLSLRERSVTAYQLVRTTLGEAAVSPAGSSRHSLSPDGGISPAPVRWAKHGLRVPGVLTMVRALDRGENPA